MSAPKDVAKRLPVHFGRTAPPRDPNAGWRDVGCKVAPTGWPVDDAKTRHAAGFEALAKAGAARCISNLPIGKYFAGKRLGRCATAKCRTMVCAMAAGRSMRRSKERKGCMCRCSSFRKAARLADEREISRLLKDLAGNPERRTKKEEEREAS